jgi:hypothetical protein
MRSRTAAVCLIAASPFAVAGCGAAGASVAGEGGDDLYVERAEGLMRPVGEMVSAIGRRADTPEAPGPSRTALRTIVQRAEAGLEAFRALDPHDEALRSQQARISVQYARVVDDMAPVAEALADGRSGADLQRVAAPFFASLGELPAAAESAP